MYEFEETVTIWPVGSNPMGLYKVIGLQWTKDSNGVISYTRIKGDDLKKYDMTIIDYTLLYNKSIPVVHVQGFRGEKYDLVFENYSEISYDIEKKNTR
jgi:hypothetical protein